jgi:hypothetical protein
MCQPFHENKILKEDFFYIEIENNKNFIYLLFKNEKSVKKLIFIKKL